MEPCRSSCLTDLRYTAYGVADTAVIHGYDSGRSDRLLDYDYGNTSPTLQLSMGTTVVVLIGCWITIMGILRIVHAFQLRKVTAYVDIFGRPVSNDWYMALLPGIAMVAVGILNVLHPSIGLGMIGALVGVLMLLCGSTLLSFGQLSWFW